MGVTETLFHVKGLPFSSRFALKTSKDLKIPNCLTEISNIPTYLYVPIGPPETHILRNNEVSQSVPTVVLSRHFTSRSLPSSTRLQRGHSEDVASTCVVRRRVVGKHRGVPVSRVRVEESDRRLRETLDGDEEECG